MIRLVVAPLLLIVPAVAAQTRAPAAAASVQRSAPITDVRYEVTFNPATAAARSMGVAMSFDVASTNPVLLSLPAWTPGAYEISNFARKVNNFAATQGGAALDWDKSDYDTWRVVPARTSGRVTVSFEFRADSLDNAMSWSRQDFLLFNGTNVFMYPEGRSLSFPATVAINKPAQWKIATGMHQHGPTTFGESNYHDLVDMPFFVGEFDIDSLMVVGKWMRLATYPSGSVQGARRSRIWSELAAMTPPQVAVFGEVPWRTYTVMQIADSAYAGASGLEHQNSHVDIVTTAALDNPFMTSLYSHEIVHVWNVKRLRPVELWPYRYDAMQPTTLLWVSEGITDYYADIALLRGGLADSAAFLQTTEGKIVDYESSPPTALEDASLSTWVSPANGTHYLYYPKGSVAGFLLDIIIRDASNNASSLDAVMRDLYNTKYKRGEGFSEGDWWRAVARAANGRSFSEFRERYVDGREPFPFAEVLPLAGIRVVTDTTGQPRIGVFTVVDSVGVRVQDIVPGSSAAQAGIQPGDLLLAIGDVRVEGEDFAAAFRERYSRMPEGTPLVYVVRRRGTELRLTGALRQMVVVRRRLSYDPAAGPKAVRVRDGLLRGTTQP